MALTMFFTDEVHKTLIDNPIFDKISDQFNQQTSHQDWQQCFCDAINYHLTQIPWNLLRAKKFSLSDDIQTIACCDPIAIQMTHRGAYCWGQESLNVSKKDAQIIVEEVNRVLMDEGEQLLLTDSLEWLYVSNKGLSLDELSYQRLVGKDLFDFSYQGANANKWSRLATEIQMLIKQLMDFNKIQSCAPEASVSVHFWGDTNLVMDKAFPTLPDNDNMVIYSSHQKLNDFALQNALQVKPLAQLGSDQAAGLLASNAIVVAPSLSSLEVSVIEKNTHDYPWTKIIVRNHLFSNRVTSKKTFIQKLFSLVNDT